MPDVTLKVNDREFTGWKTARVTRGIESAAGSFELSVSAPWEISEGDACTVLVGGVVVLTGYVDKRRLSFAAGEHSIEVSGRDKTGQLVDCSAVLTTWDFFRTPVLTLASRLAQPFGVRVTLQSGVIPEPPPARLSADPGDSVYEVIERACRAAALLPVSDGQGGLLLTRAGSGRATTALVEGGNILAGSAEFDGANRFRRYTVRGQHAGTDELSGSPAAAVEASALDYGVAQEARVLLVRPEGNVTRASAKMRAQWEATVRAARAVTVTITVQGWTQGDGSLWPINALVPVRSPTLELTEDMLITQAVYSLDDSAGTKTELTLRLPGAFTPEPVIPKRRRKTADPLGGL